MKKFIFLSLVAVLALASANAQSTRLLIQPDTSSNTTGAILTFTNMPSKLFSIQTTVTKISGTAAGKAYLEATNDGNWIKQDSLVLADQAINTKTFLFSRTSFVSYRINYVPTGTQTSRVKATYLRRTDE